MGRRLSARDRWAVASRTIAAIASGYAFTWLFTAALALLLRDVSSIASVDSVRTATMVSFLVYAVAAMAAFCARSATRAWVGMLLAALPPVIVLVILGSVPR